MRLVALVALLLACSESPDAVAPAGRAVPTGGDLVAGPPVNVPAQGQYIFRHWTFGDEPFWTDTLHLNQVIETGVSPATALAVGLKVDAARLPPGFLAGADLTSPATTVELRSEEHTSELQSRLHLVCRLLLEKKKEALCQHRTLRARTNSSRHPAG